MLLAGGLVDVGTQPTGALTGKIVYASAGHGWRWSSTLGRWATDRGNLLSMVEDLGNQDQLTFYVDQLHRAGATVVPMRPVGRQINEVVLDNDSPGVTYSGAWLDNTTGPRWYDEDYGASTDPIKYRFALVNANETAVATYTPNIPAAGMYPVYAWALDSGNRTNQLYRVNHTGGATEVRVDHRRVGKGWVYLGTYHFDSGSAPSDGSVQISNQSTDGGSVVIADAIRFGNGMGDTPWGNGGIGTGNVSGYSREDEASLLWTRRAVGEGVVAPSSVVGTSNVSAPIRMAEAMNSDSSDYGSSIYIGFHSNASGSTPPASVRGAVGLYRTSSPTPHQLDLALAMGRQLNVDMQALDGEFEHDWSNRTNHTFAGNFGEISNTHADGEFDATIIEVGFHDNVEDSELMRDTKARRQLARSAYEGTLEHLRRYFGNTPRPINVTNPSAPRDISAVGNQSGEVAVRWNPGPSSSGGVDGVHGSPAAGYRVYASLDGLGFDGGTYVPGSSANSVTLSGLDSNKPYYFKIVAENAGGQSVASEVMAALSDGGDRQVLIVNGFDRVDRSRDFKQPYLFGDNVDRVWERYGNSGDYAVTVSKAIQDARPGVRVDSSSNEAVINGTIELTDYDSIVWILGTESTADGTFNATEQALVETFISGGGDLFVSGAETAYDLDLKDNGRDFYRSNFGATYAADDAGTYSASPDGCGIFSGLGVFTFSDGAQFSSLDSETYDVAFPDVLTPQSDSSVALRYGGPTGGVAAIEKVGTNGAGNVVNLGFPFETIEGASVRSALMNRVLGFFDVEPPTESPPQVSEIIIGDGSSQRSSIRSITVNFDSPIAFDTGAFDLKTKEGTGITLLTSVSPGTTTNQVVLSFPNLAGGSLADGNYRLTILDSHVRDTAGNSLDGDRDGESGGAAVNEFYRMFGDTNGDRDVDGQDYGRFAQTFLKQLGQQAFESNLDYDNDGDVDGQDYGQLGRRFLRRLDP